MPDEKKSENLSTAIAHAAAAFANTPFPYLLGIALMFLASKWDGHLHEQKGCFQLEEINNAVYKVNTCTGETEEIKKIIEAEKQEKLSSALNK